ncbi:MAG: hypothetical protein ACI8TP_004837 [Acidimicrobiales bacterium]
MSTNASVNSAAVNIAAVNIAAPAHPLLAQLWDLLRNTLLLAALYAVYALVRRVTADDWGTAYLNAERLLNFQRAIGLPSEASLQQGFFLDRPQLVRAANTFYMWVHFPVTTVFMLWVFFTHRHRFAAVRNALIALTLGGLALHVAFPLVPPRMKPSQGFVDTGAVFGPNPYDLEASEAANQIAAMPSLHVGWAMLVAICIIALCRGRFRYLAAVHPIVTTSVVILTANHYWTDAIIAALLVAGAWFYTMKLSDVGRFAFKPSGKRSASLESGLLPDLAQPELALPELALTKPSPFDQIDLREAETPVPDGSSAGDLGATHQPTG